MKILKFGKNLTPEFFNSINVETFLKLYKLNMKKYAVISNKKRNELIERVFLNG